MAKQKNQGERRRFQRGIDDLEQLQGIEEEQRRSWGARRKYRESKRGEPPAGLPPLINRIDKSKKRLQNRLARIKDYGDAIGEFGS